MSETSAHGRVDKVIQIVAVSPVSWEDAAQNAVSEAAKSIRDLGSARVLKHDLTVANGAPMFRIKLQVAFQVDRSRIDPTDPAGGAVQVRRYLVVANRTLANTELIDFIAEHATNHAEFHVIVPQAAPSVLHADPATGLIGPGAHTLVAESRAAARDEGEARLANFRAALGDQGSHITGEVVLGDPTSAVRTVMARSTFDEVIVSTLPAGASRWLKLDLPSRLQRVCKLPVTTLVQREPQQ